MMGSALGIMGKPLTLPSVLYVNTKRSHGLLRDPIACSRVFRFPNTLETPRNRQVPRPTQTQAHRYKSALEHYVSQHDSWALSSFHLCLRLSCSRSHAWNANAGRNVNADARNGRSGLRQRLKVKLSCYLPTTRTNYFNNSFAFAAVELWDSLPFCLQKETFLQNSRRRSGRTYYLSQPLYILYFLSLYSVRVLLSRFSFWCKHIFMQFNFLSTAFDNNRYFIVKLFDSSTVGK